MNILLGVTGSVASIYTPRLVSQLKEIGNVKVVLTPVGDEFSNIEHIHSDVYTEEDEHWEKNGDKILHIELRKWADIMVIAPMSANTMAKISYGICDNMLTQIVRAWDFNKPILVCPAMNTLMWESDVTYEQIEILTRRGFHVMNPIEKTLACGDTGIGALPTHDAIVEEILDAQWSCPFKREVFIPLNDHPGSFGAVRKHDIHTGVDIYAQDGEEVLAVEDGKILSVLNFTGASIMMPWWEETQCMFVQGKYGVVNYGEITPANVAGSVRRGQVIGKVKRVLKPGRERPDIPHHSLSMLHLEYYKHETRNWAMWNLGEPKPKHLLNPTSRLESCRMA